MNNNWFRRSRRRFLLDYHIDSWNEEFLSKYDPDIYAEACFQSGATAATYMANTHTGLLSWPSRLGGVMHPGLRGLDMLGATINALHKRSLDAIVYYVFIYVQDYWNKHPEARSVKADGTSERHRINTVGNPRRFATCCFNNEEYRKFSLAELAEICDNYDFEGVWPDMTFWPAVCYCDNCRLRYHRETGGDLPQILDWKNPAFVRFIRIRQRWLREFGQEITDTIKNRKPGMKLAQQSQAFTCDWVAGGSAELADCWDWISADTYNGRYGMSYVGKLYYSLSNIKPYELINCWNWPNIHEHSVTKTEDEMRQVAFSTIMNDGALVVIDQIDPIGTIHIRNYEMMKKIFAEIAPYEPFLGGNPCYDVGIYYSLNSNFDQAFNGKNMCEYNKNNPVNQVKNTHFDCVANAAKTLIQHHIPYGMITKKNLGDLQKCQALILPNVAMMDEVELSAVRKFVAAGGSLYASKETSTISGDGIYDGSFLLSDLFGVKAKGLTKEEFTFVSPASEGAELFPYVFSKDYPPPIHDSQMKLEVINTDSKTLGTITLPYAYPREDRHGSILTTPPGRWTEMPALVETSYGKGTVIYSGALLELETHQSQQEVFGRVIRRLLRKPLCIKTDAPAAVEIVRFDKSDEIMAHVLNFQAELPNIPVNDISISLLVGRKTIKNVFLVPDGSELSFSIQDDYVCVNLPVLQNYALIRVQTAGKQ